MFLLPVKRDWPIRSESWVVYSLILTNSVIFLLTWIPSPYDDAVIQNVARRFGFVPSRQEPLTVVTSMFIHADWLHLLGNMYFLWMFGESVEGAVGHAATLPCYLASGVAGNILHYVFNTGSTIPCIGASGAISGVVGMYMVLFSKSKIDLVFFVWTWPVGKVSISALVALLAWLGEQSLLGLVAWISGWGFGTAFMGHVGGLLAGIVLTFLVTRLGLLTPQPVMMAMTQAVCCPVCQASLCRRRAGRYRCPCCRNRFHIDEAGNTLVGPLAKNKAHKTELEPKGHAPWL